MAEEYRGWIIEKDFFGWCGQHPDFDPENDSDRRYLTGASRDRLEDEINIWQMENENG